MNEAPQQHDEVETCWN